MSFIYINFNDLKQEVQEEIIEIVREEVEAETSQEEADDLCMNLDDLITERIERKLCQFNYEGKFVFNI